MPVLQLICYTSGTLKICSNLLLTNLPIYITKDSLLLWHFNSNIYMTFIYAILPTSFSYGILLNVNEQMFCRFYRTGARTMIDIMVSLINTII